LYVAAGQSSGRDTDAWRRNIARDARARFEQHRLCTAQIALNVA
jgi:hypothetical protein